VLLLLGSAAAAHIVHGENPAALALALALALPLLGLLIRRD
jgi:hypothetical protein